MTTPTRPRIACVLGPGGLPALDAHAGALCAIAAVGLRPTTYSGTSAGAIAAAYCAAGHSAHVLSSLIQGLATADVVAKRHAWKIRAYWLDAICDPAPIQALLARHLPATFDELQRPCSVAATAMLPGEERAMLLADGDLRSAVLASMSVAGIWPYVRRDGILLSDGWPTLPLPLAGRGDEYDLVLVLNPQRSLPYSSRDHNVLSRLLWTAETISRRRVAALRELYQATLGDQLVWLDLELGDGSSLQFDHELAERTFTSVSLQLSRCHVQWEDMARV